jgi:hypothetical protein
MHDFFSSFLFSPIFCSFISLKICKVEQHRLVKFVQWLYHFVLKVQEQVIVIQFVCAFFQISSSPLCLKYHTNFSILTIHC